MRTARQLAQYDRSVHAILTAAHSRMGEQMPVDHHTPLDALISQEFAISGDDYEIKSEAVCAILSWLFESGPAPATVVKRLFSLTRAVKPELMLNMSGAEIAALFGQGRAAESARSRMILGETLGRVGYKNTQLPYQKSPSACAKYAQVQRGNRNRVKARSRAA